MVLAFVPFFAAILRIPFAILTPLIVFVCAIGAYAVHNSMIDIWYMLIFGVIGYVFKKLDYPLAPLVLALVLGDMAENALRQSLIMSQGSLAIFFNRPIAGVITAVALLFFMYAHHHSVVAATARPACSNAGAAGNLIERSIDGIGEFNRSSGRAGLGIVIIDLSLAGDNALVIAMAVLTLPSRQRLIGLIGGTVGAVVLRIILIAVITQILLIPLLQALGGLVLIWIAVKLVRQDAGGETEHKVREVATLWEAIGIIMVADLIMSLDNVLAVAATAHGDLLSCSSASGFPSHRHLRK